MASYKKEENTKKQKILVVDDEAAVRRILTMRLAMAGYEVVSAADGEEALEMFASETPDLMVLDVMLPRLTGFEVLKWIRAHERLAKTPVLILTAKGQEPDRLTAQSLGVDEFITKPFSNQEVVACVERLTTSGA